MIFFIDRSKIVLRSEHAQVERPNNELGGTRPPQVQIQKMLPNVVEYVQNMYLILRQDYIDTFFFVNLSGDFFCRKRFLARCAPVSPSGWLVMANTHTRTHVR